MVAKTTASRRSMSRRPSLTPITLTTNPPPTRRRSEAHLHQRRYTTREGLQSTTTCPRNEAHGRSSLALFREEAGAVLSGPGGGSLAEADWLVRRGLRGAAVRS